jgi:hypothetical protein
MDDVDKCRQACMDEFKKCLGIVEG